MYILQVIVSLPTPIFNTPPPLLTPFQSHYSLFFGKYSKPPPISGHLNYCCLQLEGASFRYPHSIYFFIFFSFLFPFPLLRYFSWLSQPHQHSLFPSVIFFHCTLPAWLYLFIYLCTYLFFNLPDYSQSSCE